ncbi:EamA family transporter [Streptomyces sp. NPDC091416]|uniref:EamA family transporter n=1 Tax=Streptomyces sp. NPDC091416 TaxID=3366003 RepID=UPI00382C734F
MSSVAVPVLAPPRRAWLTDLPVLLVAVVWGSSYLAAKGITTTQTVIAVLVLRFAVVLPVLVIAGWPRLRALTAAQWRGAGLLGLVLSGIFLVETYGLVHTSATNAGLIISLTMIFTPLAEAAVTRNRPTGAFLAAAGLSVAGVVLLTQGGGFTSPSAGDLLMLVAALARTLHVLLMARIKSVRSADSLSLTTVQLGSAVTVFALLTAAPGTGESPWSVAAGFGAREWGGLLFLSRAGRAERARQRIALLADREREVAVAVGRGRSNAEIAAALYLSVATVKTQVSRILAKFDFNNRVQIALLVHDAGLLDDDGDRDPS